MPPKWTAGFALWTVMAPNARPAAGEDERTMLCRASCGADASFGQLRRVEEPGEPFGVRRVISPATS